jgi:hypothetical protein
MEMKRVIAITRLYSCGYIGIHEENAVWLEGAETPYAFSMYYPLPEVGQLVDCSNKCWNLQHDKYEMPTKLHKLLAGLEHEI